MSNYNNTPPATTEDGQPRRSELVWLTRRRPQQPAPCCSSDQQQLKVEPYSAATIVETEADVVLARGDSSDEAVSSSQPASVLDRPEDHVVEREEKDDEDFVIPPAADLEAEEEDFEDDDDEVSVSSPPDSWPVVIVDLERLAGFAITAPDEVAALYPQVCQTLYGVDRVPKTMVETVLHPNTTVVPHNPSNPQDIDGHHHNPDEENENAAATTDEDEVLAQHFESRVAELFEHGMARHADTTSSPSPLTTSPPLHEGPVTVDHNASYRWMTLPYPDYLCCLNNDETAELPRVLSTSRLWKRQLKPHPVPVVDNLLRLVRDCSRSLLWKDAIRSEIVHLARSEQRALRHRQRKRELQIWKTTRRREQLQQLYRVHATLGHCLDRAQAQLEEQEQRAIHAAGAAGASESGPSRNGETQEESPKHAVPATSNHTTGETFLVDEDGWEDRGVDMDDFLGIEGMEEPLEMDNDEEERLRTSYSTAASDTDAEDSSWTHHHSDSDAEADDERSNDSEDAMNDADNVAVHEGVDDDEPSHQEQEEEGSWVQEEQEYEENRIPEQFMTPQLKNSIAVVQALEQRMERVEELLESLQEEELADEEEDQGAARAPLSTQNTDSKPARVQTATTPSLAFSLVDQIVAMVLSATPLPIDDDMTKSLEERQQQHVQRQYETHQRLAREWKEHFGRLPPAVGPSVASAHVDIGDDRDVIKSVEANDSMADSGPLQEAKFVVQEGRQLEEAIRGLCVEEDGVEYTIEPVNRKAVEVTVPRKQVTGLRPGGRLQ